MLNLKTSKEASECLCPFIGTAIDVNSSYSNPVYVVTNLVDGEIKSHCKADLCMAWIKKSVDDATNESIGYCSFVGEGVVEKPLRKRIVKPKPDLPTDEIKLQEEKGYVFTERQNLLLSRLRAVASEKKIEVSIVFETETYGRISFTRPGGDFCMHFEIATDKRDGFSDAISATIYQIERIVVPKPSFPPNRMESEDHRKNSKR